LSGTIWMNVLVEWLRWWPFHFQLPRMLPSSYRKVFWTSVICGFICSVHQFASSIDLRSACVSGALDNRFNGRLSEFGMKFGGIL
jgi:hypothetical protein